MENNDERTKLSVEIREAICLMILGAALIILTYLFCTFVVQSIPFPFGTFEDFSAF